MSWTPYNDDKSRVTTARIQGCPWSTWLDGGSIAGIPGISVPAGLTRAGLPVGLELDGPLGSDARLLSVAQAIEAVLGRTPPPPGI